MSARPAVAGIFLCALAALGIGACGGGDEEADGAEALTVYVSLPLSGPAAAEGRDAADGARLALADAGGEAGGVEVGARFLDAGAPGFGWTPSQSAANARIATRDSTAIAYVGDFQSGATRASLPVTNKAFLLQVSPASGAGDLVAEFPGSDEISDLQTTGERTFGRVIPSDEQQAEAAVAWAAELGWSRIRVRSDGTDFGRELADAFTAAARGARRGRGFAPFTYLAGGEELAEPVGGEPIRSSGGLPRMASDAFLPPYLANPDLIAPILVTSAALDPTDLPPAGREFPERFTAEYGRRPGRYAAYGYEAMAVVLDSLDRAEDPADRQSVVEAFFDTMDRDSILGPYSITETGDSTVARMTGYELGGRDVRPVTTLKAP
jgi:branched-chain amino acid transport system substrate-binding protein